MIKVVYDTSYGLTVADGRALMMVRDWIHHRNMEIVVSNQLFINFLRLAIKLGKISSSEVEFYFRNKLGETTFLPVTPDGFFTKLVPGFCEEHDWCMSMLMTPPGKITERDRKIFDMTTTNIFPAVVAHSEKTVTLGFTHNGQEVRVELPRTMIKGQAKWAARHLIERGATVPEYGTKECKDWAKTLREAAVPPTVPA
jgi:hypothetical protein